MSRYRHRRLKHKLDQLTQPPTPAVSDDLGQALDALNAWGYLEDCVERNPAGINCYGPGVFRGLLPFSWVGVCLWYKPRGYHHYSLLSIVGIWAFRSDGQTITAALGQKSLPYRLPIFNPEAYHYRIQHEFKTSYQDNGAPPAASLCDYTTVYQPEKRLEIRAELQQRLVTWLESQQQAGAP